MSKLGGAARRLVSGCAAIAAAAVIALVGAVSFLLGRLGIGRLLDQVSLPHFRVHRGRTVLTVLGVSLGIAVQLSVAVVNRSVFDSIADSTRDLAPNAQLQIVGSSSGFNDDLVEKVAAVAGVLRAAPSVQEISTIADSQAHGERLMILGVDLLGDEESSFRSYESADLAAIRRDPFRFLDSSTNILLGRDIAQRLHYRVNDKVTLATPHGAQSFDIKGLIETSGVGRAFGGSVAIMYYPAMQVAFDRGTKIDKIDVATAPNTPVAGVQRRLRALVGAGFQVESPSNYGQRIARTLGVVRDALSLGGLIALLAGAFLLYNTVNISITQRNQEFATLRALGLSRRAMLQLIVLEAVLLGLVGAVLGVSLGLVLSPRLLVSTQQALSEVYLPLTQSQAAFPIDLAAEASVMGVVFCAISAAMASRRIASLSPAHALGGQVQGGEHDRTVVQRSGLALACCCVGCAWAVLQFSGLTNSLVVGAAASLLLVAAGLLALPSLIRMLAASATTRVGHWLGIRFLLAANNLRRDLRRNASSISAIMVCIAMAVSFSTFVKSFSFSFDAWVQDSLSANLFITQGSNLLGSAKNTPMNDTIYEGLRTLPGVTAVQRVRLVDTTFREQPIKLVSTDIRAMASGARVRTVECTREQALEGWSHGAVTVSENFAERFDVHCGNQITLPTSAGSRAFTVAAVVIDYNSESGSVMMDRATFVRDWADERVDAYQVHLRAGSDSEVARRSINERYADSLGLFVLTNDEFRELLAERTSNIFNLVRGLSVLAILIAVLGITNTQFANVLDRVREIGILRSLGMQRGQVAALMTIEALLMGGLAGIVGSTIGFGLGYVLVRYIGLAQTGWHLSYQASLGSTLTTVLLVTLTAAVGSYFPGRTAAQLRITDALSAK
jgi:putative ABC transport system permease protein